MWSVIAKVLLENNGCLNKGPSRYHCTTGGGGEGGGGVNVLTKLFTWLHTQAD